MSSVSCTLGRDPDQKGFELASRLLELSRKLFICHGREFVMAGKDDLPGARK
jgi:hypothetical protein